MNPHTMTAKLEQNMPDYLRAVIDEAEEAVKMESDPDLERIAHDTAREQLHLIMNRNEPDNLEVLQALRELGALSAKDLGMNRTAAPSYERAEATIEALVTASLERFICSCLTESDNAGR